MSVVPFLIGLLTGWSLIIAIGAQNAYVIRQGLLRQHVPKVVAVCAVSDLILIFAGLLGVGAVIMAHPWILTVTRIVGGCFLIGYGILALRRAGRTERLIVEVPDGPSPTRGLGVILKAVALTWLNPHVYLDTVALLGTIGSQYGPQRWWFGAGAGTASLSWFTVLGFGAARLGRWLARPRVWRVIDLTLAVIMVALGLRLLLT